MKKIMHEFNLKGGLKVQFTACEAEIMPKVALISFIFYDAYCSVAVHAQ